MKQWRETELECDKLLSEIILWVDNGKCALYRICWSWHAQEEGTPSKTTEERE